MNAEIAVRNMPRLADLVGFQDGSAHHQSACIGRADRHTPERADATGARKDGFADAPSAAVGLSLVGVALGPKEREEPILHSFLPVPLRRIAMKAGRAKVLEKQVAAGV